MKSVLNAHKKKLIFVPRTFCLLLSIKNFNLFTFYRLTEWSLLKLSYLIVNAKYESVPTLERSELQYSSSASVRRWSSDVVRLQMTSQSSARSVCRTSPNVRRRRQLSLWMSCGSVTNLLLTPVPEGCRPAPRTPRGLCLPPHTASWRVRDTTHTHTHVVTSGHPRRVAPRQRFHSH